MPPGRQLSRNLATESYARGNTDIYENINGVLDHIVAVLEGRED